MPGAAIAVMLRPPSRGGSTTTESPGATDRTPRGPAYRAAISLAVPVGWFAARFQPAGMARTMVGVALMQAFLGLLAATAPVIANTPDGSLKALLFNGGFAALWLVSAAFFGAAARSQGGTPA